MKYLAIGDVHGCSEQLALMLDKEELYHGRKVVFLGDYVDVGPDAAGVVELLVTFRVKHRASVFLRGNHDEALLSYLRTGAFAEYATVGGLPTIRSYAGVVNGDVLVALKTSIPSEHRLFLENLEAYYECDNYLFSHRGYDPSAPSDRSVSAMVLTTHASLFTDPPTLSKTVVCGHYFQRTLRPHLRPGVICLDTGCGILGGPLTAIQLPEERIFQVTKELEWI